MLGAIDEMLSGDQRCSLGRSLIEITVVVQDRGGNNVSQAARPRGMFFDEFELGQSWDSPARTITEADVTLFAGFSGDFNPLHTDEEFAKTTQFGGRIFHGPGVFAIATGLESRLGLKEGTAI